jgi:hypothetical protein
MTAAAVLSAGGPGSAVDSSDEPAAASRGLVSQQRPAPVSLVVWDAARTGIDIRSARRDGTDQKRLFHQDRGYTSNLTLSRDGRDVAFSPYRGGARARLMIVRTNGGGASRNLLAGHRRLEDVGVLAWSVDGSKIAFEGFVDEPSAGNFYPAYLFTIHTDGTTLKRHQLLDDGRDNGAVFGTMAWTRHGIVYPDDDRIVLLRGATRQTLARNASDVSPSGNNHWIFFRRPLEPPKSGQVLWGIRPDGTDLQRVAAYSDQLGDLLGTSPNFRGTRLLAQRTMGSGSQLISFAVTTPRRVREVPIPGSIATAVWH